MSELAVTYSTPHTTMQRQIEGSASFSAVMEGALACRWETWSSFSSTTGRPLVSCLSHHPSPHGARHCTAFFAYGSGITELRECKQK